MNLCRQFRRQTIIIELFALAVADNVGLILAGRRDVVIFDDVQPVALKQLFDRGGVLAGIGVIHGPGGVVGIVREHGGCASHAETGEPKQEPGRQRAYDKRALTKHETQPLFLPLLRPGIVRRHLVNVNAGTLPPVSHAAVAKLLLQRVTIALARGQNGVLATVAKVAPRAQIFRNFRNNSLKKARQCAGSPGVVPICPHRPP